MDLSIVSSLGDNFSAGFQELVKNFKELLDAVAGSLEGLESALGSIQDGGSGTGSLGDGSSSGSSK
ncbi:hypothetical protein AALF15_01675 [Corynebacteriaceae bacterium 7-707]